jgi:hypothetical protein
MASACVPVALDFGLPLPKDKFKNTVLLIWPAYQHIIAA